MSSFPWSTSSWSSRIFRGTRESAPNHYGDPPGFPRSPAAQIDHPALPFPHSLSLQSPRSPPSASPSPALSSSSASSTTIQPYSMVSTPHQYNSAHDMDDEGECPVCLEPLSFSFRLPGEKPHIVPECGHALHEVCHLIYPHTLSQFLFAHWILQACFSAVYGPPPGASRAGPRKSNLGVCGVCRRPMKVPDGDGGKSNSTSLPVFPVFWNNYPLSRRYATSKSKSRSFLKGTASCILPLSRSILPRTYISLHRLVHYYVG